MQYRIYDYFLGEYLPFETNYGEDLPEPAVGWHVLMTDASGLTGERTAIGISPLDTAEVEDDLCKVRFEAGKLNADIYLGDQASKGVLVGLPIGMASGAGVGQARRRAGIGAAIGATLAGLGGFLLGKAMKVWKVRYR